jgi:ribA/ribD-fused uncharacterized protein
MSSKIKIPTTFEDFCAYKHKKPRFYTFSEEGNAIVIDRDGTVLHTIELPYYRQTTFQEIDTLNEERKEKISVEEDAIEKAQEKLRQRIQGYKDGKRSATTVMIANIDVEKADIARQVAKYPLQFINVIPSIDRPKVILNERYDTRKLEFPLVCNITYPHDLQELYVREGEAPVLEERVSSEELSISMTGEIYFDDPEDAEYGFLSPYWPVEFVVGTTLYFTAGQAAAAEAATHLEAPEWRKKILDTRSPKTIRKLRRDMLKEKGAVAQDILRDIVMAVQRAKFTQHRELLDRLLETGDAPLMYANSSKSEGLGRTYEEIKAGSKPTGTNLLGEVLQDLRTELRGSTTDADTIIATAKSEAAANKKEATVSAEKVEARRRFFIRRNSGAGATA